MSWITLTIVTAGHFDVEYRFAGWQDLDEEALAHTTAGPCST